MNRVSCFTSLLEVEPPPPPELLAEGLNHRSSRKNTTVLVQPIDGDDQRPLCTMLYTRTVPYRTAKAGRV